jgi:hypothetical protein
MSEIISIGADFTGIPKSTWREEDWYIKCDWEGWINSNLTVLGVESDHIDIECPWASSHSGGDNKAAIYLNDGKPGFNCFHSHCQGNTFKDVLDMFDPKSIDPYLPKKTISIDYGTVDCGGDTTTSTANEFESITIPDVSLLADLGKKHLPTIYNVLIFLGETSLGHLAIKSNDSDIIKIIRPSEISEKTLLSIYTDSAVWLAAFSVTLGKGVIKIDISTAAEWLIKESKKAGSYDDKERAGLGLHWDYLDDKKVVVLNTGKKVYMDKTFSSYDESWKILGNYYVSVSRKINIPTEDMPPSLPGIMFELMSRLSFKNKEEAAVFFGSVVALMMCGATPIRPIVNVRGPTQSGKSVIISMIATMLMKAAGGINCSVGSTAAGITQSLQGNVPMVFDECEPDSVQSSRQIDMLMEILLSGTTGQGADILKGTKNQVAIQSHFKTGGIFGSIGSKAPSAALEIRSISINIVNSKDTSEVWFAKKRELEKVFCKHNCELLFKYLVDHVDMFLENVELCSNLCSQKKDVVTSSAALYGTTMGALVTVLRQRVFDYERDKSIVSAVFKVMMEACESKDKSLEKNKVDIYNTLFTLEFKDIQENKSYLCGDLLSDIIFNKQGGMDADRILLHYGIKIRSDMIWISTKCHLLSAAFEKNKLFGYKDRLKYLPEVIKMPNPTRFGPIKTYAYGMPLPLIKSKLESDDDTKPESETEPVGTLSF